MPRATCLTLRREASARCEVFSAPSTAPDRSACRRERPRNRYPRLQSMRRVEARAEVWNRELNRATPKVAGGANMFTEATRPKRGQDPAIERALCRGL